MIYILHGEDTIASYERLLDFEQKFSKSSKINFAKDDNLEKLYLAIWGENLFETQSVIFCKDLLAKIDRHKLQDIPESKTIIFWEQTELSAKILNSFKNVADIERFKPKPHLYWFLDSLGLNPIKVLSELQSSNLLSDPSLIWNITNRTLLLILAKLQISGENSAKIMGRKIEIWQWQKIVDQAKLFDLKKLISFYNGSIKLDFIIKKGESNLDQKTLIPILLLKYLTV